MDETHRTEAYSDWKHSCGCLRWDLFCLQGLHAAPQPGKVLRIRGGSKLWDWDDAVADLALYSTGVE